MDTNILAQELASQAIYDLFDDRCKDRDHVQALQLLETHGPIIISSGFTYINHGAFRSVCINGWHDLAELLVSGFSAVLTDLPFYMWSETFEAFLAQGWTDMIVALVGSMRNLEHRTCLINEALRYWFLGGQTDMRMSLIDGTDDTGYQHIYKQFDMYQVLIDKIGDDIDDTVLEYIVSNDCNHDNYDLTINTRKHELINAVIDRFRDRITSETYEQVLRSACQSGCESMLDRFTSDLSLKVSDEEYDRVLVSTLKCYSWFNSFIPLVFIKRFSSKLSTPVCQQMFDRLCGAAEARSKKMPSLLIANCLEYVGNRVSFGLRDGHILNNYWCLLNISAPDVEAILRLFKNGVSSDVIRWVAAARWRDHDIIAVLIKYCKNKIDGCDIVGKALASLTKVITDQEPNIYLQKGDTLDEYAQIYLRLEAVGSCKYILNCFFTDISLAHTVTLLGLDSDTLYSILGLDDVKILVDTYKHDGDLDEGVECLDPTHENTSYVMANYKNRRVKAVDMITVQ